MALVASYLVRESNQLPEHSGLLSQSPPFCKRLGIVVFQGKLSLRKDYRLPFRPSFQFRLCLGKAKDSCLAGSAGVRIMISRTHSIRQMTF